VAMGSGSPASRAVAEVVLLDGAFSSLPEVVAEGRRVIANIERVANLFLTKTVWAIILAVVVGLAGRRYPFLPRHLTLTAAVASSIPGFFLALAPSARRARTGFVARVLRFVVVSGPIVAAAVIVVEVVCRHVHGETDLQVQTADLIALDEALSRLAQFDERPARLVELRFFSGLSVEETAEALGISSATVKNDWRTAKAWLFREING